MVLEKLVSYTKNELDLYLSSGTKKSVQNVRCSTLKQGKTQEKIQYVNTNTL